ncbi:DUF732 domain-containing protein [Mycolicibacter sp. MYC123]|uniref:DUF732 domain-containing protein n=1 Tax=[Mycobacterium] zoologicum TaxID=2872311 RepID=A0ABU5YQ72_9MYCO|nr:MULTISPECIES: DUF732 domain-containing protein [unclassified Mycolicibacter]MEB3050873.1 DUF732 domain-containing protein [Mycolicibacter sp. MYC123]MEB3061278.1 DUF732 domain-containing protein [Mycolicibacter sp. MYC101]
MTHRAALLAGVAGPAAIAAAALAGPVQADPATTDTDNTFLGALRASGITYNHADQAIITAKLVCGLIAEGRPSPEVLEGLKARNPGLSTEHGTLFVGIAAHTYCPDQLMHTTEQP